MKIGKNVVKHRFIILGVALFLLIPSFFGYIHTRINYDMLTYLPKNMETMKGQEILKKDFGKGGFTIIVTENMKKSEVNKMANDYKKIKHVESVANLNKVIDPTVPAAAYPKSIGDKNASMIVVFLDTSVSDEGSLNAIKEIRKVSTKHTYVSGMSACVQDLKALCEKEESKYILIAVALSLIAMMLLLDSYLAPFIFLLCIGVAILYNMGTNIVFGEISYITKAIAAVLQLGVTMDYSIFLWHSYVERLNLGEDELDAMGNAIDDTFSAVMGSSITTIAGFLALCFMTYTMGRDLGIVMAKGVVFGVICSVTVLPAMLLAVRHKLMKSRHHSLLPDTTKLSHGLTSRYGIYIAVFAVLLLPAIYGYHHVDKVYDFSKILNGKEGLTEQQAPFLKANERLREDFNIGTTHMIIADADLDRDKGVAMNKELNDVTGVSSVVGMDSFVGPAVPYDVLPDQIRDSFEAKGHKLILVNSSYKVSTKKCNDQVGELKDVCAKYDPGAKVIGEAAATKDLINLTDRDFKVVNIISIAAVFFIIFFVLKSWVLPIILVAVIEFAIYVNMGICGFTGLDLAFIVPVCISTIQLGSTVDYAILLSTRYKTERMRGLEKRDAIVTATATSMPSIITSAVVFFTATFGAGIYSNVGIISILTNLMARGALISMASVLLVLPSLLMAFDKQICKTTRGLKDIYRKEHAAA